MSSKIRFFKNPFEDYTNSKSIEDVIIQNTISPKSIVATGLGSKWEKTAKALEGIKDTDYSVYTGTAGIALLKLLKDPSDKSNLEGIISMLCLSKLKNRRSSFICGDAGPYTIGAIAYNKLGDKNASNRLITKLMSMQDDAINVSSDLPNEFLYGRAGYLFALLYVNKNINPPPIPTETIRKIIDAMISCGTTEARRGNFKCPLMYQWHESFYLGAAHGVSGILYLLLQAKEFLTQHELDDLIKPTLDYMYTLRFPSGNYRSSLGSDSDKYTQWCHGAPGFVFLYSIAHEVFGDQKYLKYACEAGDIVWERGLTKKGYSLCHGVSGNAYCFLQLYQTTKDAKHLYRSVRFAEWCMHYNKQYEEHPPDRPLSLFEGIAGPMYLLLDIQKPMEAKFPGFTL